MGTTEKEIKTNDVLSVLKISCHVNDLAQDKKLSNSAFVDFDKIDSRRIIYELNELLKNKLKISNSYVTKMETKSTNNNANLCCRRKVFFNSALTKQKPNAKTLNGDGDQKIEVHQKFAKKVNSIINEGILDSVLPFVCPAIRPMKGYQNDGNSICVKPSISMQTKFENKEKDGICAQITLPRELTDSSSLVKDMKRNSKKTQPANPLLTSNADIRNQDLEVVIHVCDEIKNATQDFICPQKLLINKMGYFADVTSGQKLEDMDISVHCDIQIFEWLMKWIKKSTGQQDSLPQLDTTNVIPILVSASFLQMEPLLLDCLSFCHARLTEIVRTTANLSCLNDSIITKLAAMFTNLELEVVKDKKDRITPKLWIKLIQNLCEPEPQALRGHYYSVIGLYRCSRCCKFLTQTMSSYITCVPSNIRLNRWGQFVSQHTRELSWDLSKYISSLFKELKSWRKVYWKLWGHCHFLYCSVCECHFPIYQITWCRYHRDGPLYIGPSSEGRISAPIGHYPCCGQKVFRFEISHGQNVTFLKSNLLQGCQFREHNILIDCDRDRAILNLSQIATEGGNLLEVLHGKQNEILFSNSADFNWTGLCLIPIKCRPGLLPTLTQSETYMQFSKKPRITLSNIESSSETESSNTMEILRGCPSRVLSFSSDGYESDSNSLNKISGTKSRRHRDSFGRFWSGDLSARSNQDHQREYEERVMKHVTASANKKINTEIDGPQCIISHCGTYHRLEAEWREQLKQKNALKLKFK